MGLLDQLEGMALGALSSGGAQSPAAGLVGPLTQMLASGGLQNIVSQAEAAGLGHVVQSWIGGGQNLPITAQQLEAVLGSGVAQQLAAQVGIPADQIHNVLAQVLPHVVDHMTPGGQVPAAGAAAPDAAAVIGKLFG